MECMEPYTLHFNPILKYLHRGVTVTTHCNTAAVTSQHFCLDWQIKRLPFLFKITFFCQLVGVCVCVSELWHVCESEKVNDRERVCVCTRVRVCQCVCGRMALALRLVDVWKKKREKKKERDGDAGTEKEKSGGGEERYTEELVERKEAL